MERLELVPIPDRHVREWQGCYVVFDQRNGETHLLEGISGVVFARLLAGTATPEDLVDEVRNACDEDVRNLDDLVTTVVGELRRHRLLKSTRRPGV